MNICFYADDPKWSGLDNNGGTRTVILSAQTLESLGHNVEIVAHKNKFTWFKFKPPVHHVPKNTDVLIAVSISDVKHIQKYKGMKLVYYSRPFEIHTKAQKWQMSEEKALKRMGKFIHKYNGAIICNSGWQVKFLEKKGIPARVVFSGQDIVDPFQANNSNQMKYAKSICYQYSKKPRKGSSDIKKLATMLPGYIFRGFGSPKKCKWPDKYLSNPDRRSLSGYYSYSNFFICSSTLEGFYNCGAEAAMQGCILLVNSNPRNGCGDYADSQSAYVYEDISEVPEIIKTMDYKEAEGKVKKCQSNIINNVGTRISNMEKMVRTLNK